MWFLTEDKLLSFKVAEQIEFPGLVAYKPVI